MELIQVFLWAVIGNGVSEIYVAYRCFHNGNRILPKRYFKTSFYIVGVAWCVASGLVAIALHCSSSYTAFATGAAATKIFERVVKGVSAAAGNH